jgi:hypothetical protein
VRSRLPHDNKSRIQVGAISGVLKVNLKHAAIIQLLLLLLLFYSYF